MLAKARVKSKPGLLSVRICLTLRLPINYRHLDAPGCRVSGAGSGRSLFQPVGRGPSVSNNHGTRGGGKNLPGAVQPGLQGGNLTAIQPGVQRQGESCVVSRLPVLGWALPRLPAQARGGRRIQLTGSKVGKIQTCIENIPQRDAYRQRRSE